MFLKSSQSWRSRDLHFELARKRNVVVSNVRAMCTPLRNRERSDYMYVVNRIN